MGIFVLTFLKLEDVLSIVMLTTRMIPSHMSQFIEPEIVILALKAAFTQLSQLSLAKIGLDVTELPFWLAIVGFPLAVFDTCTKHIATALNLLLHKLHLNLRKMSVMIIAILLVVTIVIYFLFVGFKNGDAQPNMTQAELTILFYHAILVIGIFTCLLFIASLSRITGQGSYVTGIGFLMGTLSIYIEVVQEYGFYGRLACLMAFGLTVSLWIYGKNYNLELENKNLRNKDSSFHLRARVRKQRHER